MIRGNFWQELGDRENLGGTEWWCCNLNTSLQVSKQYIDLNSTWYLSWASEEKDIGYHGLVFLGRCCLSYNKRGGQRERSFSSVPLLFLVVLTRQVFLQQYGFYLAGGEYLNCLRDSAPGVAGL